MPHEFLFLLCNSIDRSGELVKQQAPPMEINRVALDDFTQNHGIDSIFKLDTNTWESWYKMPEPSKRM
jgi:hypothetical protein